jgi:carboxyl-terminal processing protease
VKRLVLVAAGAVVVLGGLITGRVLAQTQEQQRKMTALESLQLFEQVLRNVQMQYHRKAETEELIKAAIDGMLNALDPYSEFMEPEDASELRIRTTGQFGGIGIHIGNQEGRLTVMSTIEGTPAHRLGLMPGDIFAEIEGRSTQGMTIRDAVNVLRGTPGTRVSIAMERAGARDLMRYTVIREIIKIRAVPYAGLLEPGIGYVRLADFSANARQELEAALDSLVNRAGARKLVFDLRLNGGGLLQEGFEVSDLFLNRGSVIVTTGGQTPMSRRNFVDECDSPYADIPLVVLTDRGSASAAEIVAGALQDLERAVIVGETTFGKGTVQTPIPMPGAATLKLTTALWRTPSGRCVDIRTGRDTASGRQDSIFQTLGRNKRPIRGWTGIVPDVVVSYPRLNDAEMRVRNEHFFEFANRFAARHPETARDFAVTPEMRAEFLGLLREKKLELSPAQVDSALGHIDRGIMVNLSARLWGTAGEYQARLAGDTMVVRALELLGRARTEQDLFDALARSDGGRTKKN